MPETITTNNGEAKTTQDKAEAFADLFEGNFIPSPPADPVFLEEVEESIQLTLAPSLDITTFSDTNPASDPIDCPNLSNPEEIAEIISYCKPKKSAGPDGVSNYILKRLPHAIIIVLTIILNNCVNNSYFPLKWKTAKIVAIPKKGATNNISNYRPISLLSNISKVLEEIVLRKIKTFCSDNSVIPDMQFGFREKHSTLHPLLKFQHDITVALNMHRVTVGCLLDVEKAFDTVWIEGLTHKLHILGFPINLIKIIFSFLSSRNFFVQVEKSKSSMKSIRAGVAQGSKLGPFLYNIMTSDQPIPDNCENLLFADDSLTYVSSMSPVIAVKKVEDHIHRLFEFYQKWGIRINTSKSELICFRRPSSRSNRGGSQQARKCRNIALKLPDGSSLMAKQSVKYLGIHFQELLKFNPHSRIVLKKASLAFHRLYPLMKKKTGLSQQTKILIYKTLLRPVIGYSFPVWYTISKTAMRQLKVFERKILRICTGLFFDQRRKKYCKTEHLYSKAKIMPLDEYLLLSAKKLVGNTTNHPNQLIRRMTTQQRLPQPRYLSVMDTLDEEIIPLDNEEAYAFYADPGSAHHRG